MSNNNNINSNETKLNVNLNTQKSLEEKIDTQLQCYAVKNSEYSHDISRKLDVKYHERKEETYRTNFRRDRDRILYSTNFRRMQFKTQVMLSLQSDDYRTRLTHTLEVEQIALSIADALGLNKDLVSAIALGHDIGHTPFGHAVERLLNKNLCPFSHSLQSARYAVYYAYNKEGMMLADQIIDGIIKHDTDVYTKNIDEYSEQFNYTIFNPCTPPSLEGQVVYWADKIAYLSHDYEDFCNSKIKDTAIAEGKLSKEDLEEALNHLVPEKEFKEIRNRDIIRNIITNLISGSKKNLEEHKPHSSQEAIKISEKRLNELTNFKNSIKRKNLVQDSLLINFENNYREYYNSFRKLLTDTYLFSPQIQRMDSKAERIISDIINAFKSNIKLLPWDIQRLINVDKPNDKISDSLYNSSENRIIADYISGMTDRYAEHLYRDLFVLGVD